MMMDVCVDVKSLSFGVDGSVLMDVEMDYLYLVKVVWEFIFEFMRVLTLIKFMLEFLFESVNINVVVGIEIIMLYSVVEVFFKM